MDLLPLIIIITFFVLLILFRLNKAKIIGKFGEKKVSTILCLLGPEYKVFNDVLIKNGDRTSQIDHIVLSPYGIFVIETKNYRGWIYGGVNNDHWTQNIWGNKSTLTNPIRQNRGHIIALKKILPECASNQYISIIAFSSRADLRSNLPREYNVIYNGRLLSRIKEYRDIILSQEDIDKISSALQTHILTGKEEKKAHISSVRKNVQQRQLSIWAGQCPYCGGELVVRKGKYGSFYGCSNYPKCKFTCKKN